MGRDGDALLAPVGLRKGGEPGEELLLVLERVGEDHEESADDAEVAEEEGPVEKEAVTKAWYRSA
jgi:hypothetical protein